MPESIAHFECRTENMINAGDHVIFIGQIERASYGDGRLLIFSAGKYCLPAALEETV